MGADRGSRKGHSPTLRPSHTSAISLFPHPSTLPFPCDSVGLPPSRKHLADAHARGGDNYWPYHSTCAKCGATVGYFVHLQCALCLQHSASEWPPFMLFNVLGHNNKCWVCHCQDVIPHFYKVNWLCETGQNEVPTGSFWVYNRLMKKQSNSNALFQ